jgi:multiple sugar transport system ATP-binding protein
MAPVYLRDIRKNFGPVAVLKGVDLEIADGEFVSLVGPSGCGKSTLLRIIAGLETQTSGRIEIGGEAVDGMAPAARNLAMVFQSYALYPHLSVFDNIAVPLRMRRLSTLQRAPLLRWVMPGTRSRERVIRGDVRRVADLLGLQELLARRPGQLSGGQRQRVAVGRAIVREPRAFLLDEPLSNLDAKLRVHMRTEIAQLHRRLGATFIYVTHDQAEAMTMSDRIAVMMDGNIVQVGTPDQVYDDPQDLRVAEFIGSPKINVLDGAIGVDGRISLAGRPLPLALRQAHTGSIRLGLRPEALRLAAPREALIDGVLAHRENLGAEVLLHLDVPASAEPVIVRLDHGKARTVSVGAPIGISFAPEAALCFDAAGRRLPLVEAAKALEVAHG